MVAAEQLTEQALKDSVQTFSDTTYEQSTSMFMYSSYYDILPAWGTRQRDRALRNFYRAIHGGLYQGAVSGFVKKVKATPWEIKGPPRRTKYFQNIFQNANFGAGWGTFVSKLLTDYLTQDFGAVIEVIAPGDPLKPLDPVAITGISTLDSLSCGATDNPEYPVVYQSRRRPDGIHVLQNQRVKRLVDMPDPDEAALDTGLCSMSRMISPANVQILMGQYQNEKMNDLPPSGIMTVSGMTDQQITVAMNKFEADRRAAGQSIFRNIMRLPGLNPDQPPQITFTQFSQLPENFNYREYMDTGVDLIAAALNIDRQEFWTLQARNIGSGTQSEILHSKSERKGFADAYSMIERVLNLLLPEDLEFEFKFQDKEGDKADAERAQIWVNVANSATDLTREQRLQLMANNSGQLADVILDDKGQVKLPDDDVRPDEVPQVIGESDTTIGTATGADAVTADDATVIAKAASKEGYVYLSFADNADLVKLQKQLKEKFPSLELVDPGELHVTLAYAEDIDSAKFAEAFETGPVGNHLPITASVLDTFEPEYESNTPLILRVDPSAALLAFQKGIRKAIEALDVKVSAYTSSWIPHITLGYSAVPMDAPDDEFSLTLIPTAVCWARDDYEVIHETPLAVAKRKDFAGTADDFGRNFYDLIQGAIDSDINRRRFGTVARAQLRNSGTQAYKDGLEFNGVVDEELSSADLSAITDWLAETSEYVTNFANDVFDGGVSEAQIRTHVDMWANKSLRDIFNRGVLAADADAMMQWHYDPAKEHCDSCKKLHGQIHRMSAWVSRDLVPGSSELECKGFFCGCELRRTNKRASGSFLTRSIFVQTKGLPKAA